MTPHNVIKNAIIAGRGLNSSKGLVTAMKTGTDMKNTLKSITFGSAGMTSETLTDLLISASLLNGSTVLPFMNIMFTDVKTAKVAPNDPKNAKTTLPVTPENLRLDLSHGLNYVGRGANVTLSEVKAEGHNLYYTGFVTEDTLEDAKNGLRIKEFFEQYRMQSLGHTLEYVLLNGVSTVTNNATEYKFQKSFKDVGFPVDTGVLANATEILTANIIKTVSKLRTGFKTDDLVLIIPEYVYLLIVAGYTASSANSDAQEAMEMLFDDRIAVVPDSHFPAAAASATFGYVVAPSTMTIGVDPVIKMHNVFDAELDAEQVTSRIAFAAGYLDDGAPSTYKGVLKLNYSA